MCVRGGNFKATLNNTQTVARREQTVLATKKTAEEITMCGKAHTSPAVLEASREQKKKNPTHTHKSGHCAFRGGESMRVVEYAKNQGCSLQAPTHKPLQRGSWGQGRL